MKKILLISGLLLTLSIIILFIGIFLICSSKNNYVYTDNNTKKNKINNSFLTYMIETESGSGIYEKTTSNSWPESGYIFNDTLSGCENGGELKWDDENKQVLMLSVTSDKCYVYFDKYLSPTVSSVNITDTSTSSISISVSADAGTNNVATYYYSINDGAYTSSSSNNHTFSGLSIGTSYSIRVYVTDNRGVQSNVYTINIETDSIVLLTDYIKNIVYQGDGENGLYLHDGVGSYTNANLEAEDNSYRYAGSKSNNYICFGSTASTCPSDNLYRIIGLFNNQVKLIKATSYGNYSWIGSTSDITNAWSDSTLNKNTLNGTYFNALGSVWRNMIVTTSWEVGGMNLPIHSNNNVKKYFDYEIGNNSSNITYSAKIGLMYLSDFGYAYDPTYWSSDVQSSIISSTNSAIYLSGENEWTISPYSAWSNTVYTTRYNYYINSYTANNQYYVRPCFYLNSNVTYVSGSGTSSDPIRIN